MVYSYMLARLTVTVVCRCRRGTMQTDEEFDAEVAAAVAARTARWVRDASRSGLLGSSALL